MTQNENGLAMQEGGNRTTRPYKRAQPPNRSAKTHLKTHYIEMVFKVKCYFGFLSTGYGVTPKRTVTS